MSEHSAEKDAPACACGHGVAWHHDTRGCGYHGYSPEHRCPCPLRGDEVVTELLAQAWEEGHLGLCRRHGVMPFEACRNPYRVIPP